MPLVSVITPFRNAKMYFDLFYLSLSRQKYKNIQPILIDDCSTDQDETDRFALRIKSVYPATTFIRSRKNVGPGNARNLGLEASTGDLIAFHDIDDYWLPDKLAHQLSLFTSATCLGYAGYCSAYIPFDGASGKLFRPIIPNKIINKRTIARMNPIGNLTAIVFGDCARQIRYQSSIIHEDYIYWHTFISKFGPFSGDQRITALYRVGSNSFSSKKHIVFPYMIRLYQDCFGLPFEDALERALIHSMRGISKHCIFRAKLKTYSFAITQLAHSQK